jgi:hypothetical protein
MALQPLSRISTTEQLVNAVNAILRGRSNAVGSITLAVSATSTVIVDPRISADSVIILVPQTANAAAETPFQGATIVGQVTLNHASAVTTDRTYKYAIIG